MPRPTRLAALLTLLPLLAVPAHAVEVGSAGAATASTARETRMCATGSPQRVVSERLGDGPRGADITAVGLWHRAADECLWTTMTGRFAVARAQAAQVLIDTDQRRAGAEFYAFAYSPVDADQRRGGYLVGLVDGQWRRLACEVYSFFRAGKDQVGIGLPKACLGDPATVRVKVQLWDIVAYRTGNRWRGDADQVPSNSWTRPF